MDELYKNRVDSFVVVAVFLFLIESKVTLDGQLRQLGRLICLKQTEHDRTQSHYCD